MSGLSSILAAAQTVSNGNPDTPPEAAEAPPTRPQQSLTTNQTAPVHNPIIALKLFKALADSNDVPCFQQIDVSHLHEVELAIQAFMKAHLRQYGQLPSADTIRSNGFSLDVVTEEPPSYYLGRLTSREIMGHIMTHQTRLVRTLSNGNMDDAIVILREQLAAVLGVRRDAGFQTMHRLAEEVMVDMRLARSSPGQLVGVPLGFDTLNNQTGGLMPGELATWVGRPGVGKTIFLMESFIQCWRAGLRALVCSNEMPGKQLVRRLLGRLAGINHMLLKTGEVGTIGEGLLHQVITDFQHGPETHFIAGNFDQTTSALETMVAQFRPDVLFVDAAYLLKVSGMSRSSQNEKQEQIVRDMKGMLIQYNIPGMMTYQLNRDENDRSPNKRHRVDLRSIAGTDAIGKDADIINAVLRAPAPFSNTHRLLQGIKARDSEPVDIATNFSFNPPDYSEVPLDTIMGAADDDDDTAGNIINQML